MSANWQQVLEHPEFQALSPEDKAGVRDAFFERSIAPQVGDDPSLLNDARAAFAQKYNFSAPSQSQGAPMSAAQSFGAAAAQNVGSGLGAAGGGYLGAAGGGALASALASAAAGAGVGAEAGLATGPLAEFGVPIGAIIGGAVGALAGGFGGKKAQQAIEGEAYQRREEELQRAAQAHPYATELGGLLPEIPSILAAPAGGAATKALGLSKAATKVGQAAAKMAESGTQMGILSAGHAGGAVAEGKMGMEDVPGHVLKGAITGAPLGLLPAMNFPGVPSKAGQILGGAVLKGPADAATLAMAEEIYNSPSEGFSPERIAQRTAAMVPSFAVLGGGMAAIHGRPQPGKAPAAPEEAYEAPPETDITPFMPPFAPEAPVQEHEAIQRYINAQTPEEQADAAKAMEDARKSALSKTAENAKAVGSSPVLVDALEGLNTQLEAEGDVMTLIRQKTPKGTELQTQEAPPLEGVPIEEEPPTIESNAIPEPSTEEILPREPSPTGEAGGERIGVGPSEQGQETAGTSRSNAPELEAPIIPEQSPQARFQPIEMEGIGSAFDPNRAVSTKPPSLPKNPLGRGNRDILDLLNEMPLRRANKSRAGEFDQLRSQDLPPYWAKFIFAKGGDGYSPDELIAPAYEQGFIKEPSMQAFTDAVHDAIRGRQTTRAQIVHYKRAERSAIQQHKSFEKAKSSGDKQLPVSDLNPGDHLVIGGHEFEVSRVNFDDDGYVLSATIKDGPTFGVQHISGDEVLLVDEFRPKEYQETDFLPEEETSSGRSPDALFDLGQAESSRPKNAGETKKPQAADPLNELSAAKLQGESNQAQGRLDLLAEQLPQGQPEKQTAAQEGGQIQQGGGSVASEVSVAGSSAPIAEAKEPEKPKESTLKGAVAEFRKYLGSLKKRARSEWSEGDVAKAEAYLETGDAKHLEGMDPLLSGFVRDMAGEQEAPYTSTEKVPEPEAPKEPEPPRLMSQAMMLLRSRQAKDWPKADYTKADAYFETGDEAELAGMSEMRAKEVKRAKTDADAREKRGIRLSATGEKIPETEPVPALDNAIKAYEESERAYREAHKPIDLSEATPEGIQKRLAERKASAERLQETRRNLAKERIKAATRNLPPEQRSAEMEDIKTSEEREEHREQVTRAAAERRPVSAEAAREYGVKLDKDYRTDEYGIARPTSKVRSFRQYESPGKKLPVKVEKSDVRKALDKLPRALKRAIGLGDVVVAESKDVEGMGFLTPEQKAEVLRDKPEGFYANGKQVILADNIEPTVRDGDAVNAAMRVIAHENLHELFDAVVKTDAAAAKEWDKLLNLIPENDLDHLARVYGEGADWRRKPESVKKLAEEWAAKKWEEYQRGKLNEEERSLFEKVLDRIKAILKKVFIGEGEKLDDADLHAFFDSILSKRYKAKGGKNEGLHSSIPASREAEYEAARNRRNREQRQILDGIPVGGLRKEGAGDNLPWTRFADEYAKKRYGIQIGGELPGFEMVRFGSAAQPSVSAHADGRIEANFAGEQELHKLVEALPAEAAKKLVADGVDEEMTHLADFLAQRKKWEDGGKNGTFNQHLKAEAGRLYSELVNGYNDLSASDQAAIGKALSASHFAYTRQNIGPNFENIIRKVLSPTGSIDPISFSSEFVRQLVQIRRTGEITETGWQKFTAKVASWVRGILNNLNIVQRQAGDGKFGEILRNRIAETEAMLDQLETKAPEGEGGIQKSIPASRQEDAERLRGIRMADQFEEMRKLSGDQMEKWRGKCGSALVDKVKRDFETNPNHGLEVMARVRESDQLPTAEDQIAMTIQDEMLANQLKAMDAQMDSGMSGVEAEAMGVLAENLVKQREQLLRTLYESGSQLSHAFAARQLLLNSQYSFAGMIRRARRLRRGKDLTPEQYKEAEAKARELDRLNDELTKAGYEGNAESVRKLIEAINKQNEEQQKTGPIGDEGEAVKRETPPKGLRGFEATYEAMRDSLKKIADAVDGYMSERESLLREKARRQQAAASGIKPSLSESELAALSDAELDARLAESEKKIEKGIKSLADGLGIERKKGKAEPRTVLDEAKAKIETLKNPKERKAREKTPLEKLLAEHGKDMLSKEDFGKKAGEMGLEKEAADDLYDTLRAHQQGEADELPHSAWMRLMRKFVLEGVRDPHEMAKHISTWLEENGYGTFSHQEVMDRITKYGKQVFPDQDEVSRVERQIRAEMLVLRQIDDIEKGQAPKATGYQRDEAHDKLRELNARRNALMREKGIERQSAERQFASAKDRAEKRLRNLRNDSMAILAGEREFIPKGERKTYPDLDQVRKEAAILSEAVNMLHGANAEKWSKSHERILQKARDAIAKRGDAKEFKDALDELDESIAQIKDSTSKELREEARKKAIKKALERRRDALQKALDDGEEMAKAEKRPLDPEFKAIRDQIKELTGELQRRDWPKNREDRLQKLIDKADGAIDANLPPKARGHKFDDLKTEEIEQLERALQNRRYTRTLQRTLHQWQEKARATAYAPKTREERRLNAKQIEIKRKIEEAKATVEKKMEEWRFEALTPLQKNLERAVAWKRWAILSSPISIAKLWAAAGARAGTMSLENFTPTLLDVLNPELARVGTLESRASVKALSESMVEGFQKGLKDAWDTLTTGKSELDKKYGDLRQDKEGWTNFFGRLHGGLKAPVKRAAFKLAMERQIEAFVRKESRLPTKEEQLPMAFRAYGWANRQIFMNDNAFTAWWNSGVNRMEQMGHYIPASVMRFLLPIVKVPTNIAIETYHHTPVSGLVAVKDMFKIMRGGVETFRDNPDAVEDVQRRLRKGQIGLALLLIGWYAYDKFGGFYEKGEKRQPGEPQFGEAMIGGVHIPKWALHAPFFETMQLGSTMRRAVNESLHKHGKADYTSGAWAGVKGIAEELPFVGESARINEAFESDKSRNRYFSDVIRSSLIPAFSDWVARRSDVEAPPNAGFMEKLMSPTMKRDTVDEESFPHSVWQGIKSSIPMARQTLPARPSHPFGLSVEVPKVLQQYASNGNAMPSIPNRADFEHNYGKITDPKWERYVNERGRIIQREMQAKMSELRGMHDEEQRTAVSNISRKASEQAREFIGARRKN